MIGGELPAGMSYHPQWNWRQHTPQDEFVAIQHAILGWTDNLREEVSQPKKVADKVDRLMEQMKDLVPFIAAGRWSKAYPQIEGFV